MKESKINKSFRLLSTTLMFAGSTMMLTAQKRPNILFIITDDQDNATLDTYGDRECDTPNLDRLAKNGMTLTDAHQMGAFLGAVSTASRTMIMTGMYLWKAQALREQNPRSKSRSNQNYLVNGEKRIGAGNWVYDPEESSLPALFNKAGYETFRTCKQGNSYEPANALFSQRFDKTCRMPDDENGSAWHADHVIRYFNNRGKTDKNDRKPFFVYLGFSHPHDSRHGKPELLAKYGAEDVDNPTKLNNKMPKLPVNWLPEKAFPDGHPNLRDEVKVQGVGRRRDEIAVRNEKGKEFACIENIDIQIGRVLEALEKIGELDNTYIFFTSDHGIAVGKHGFMGKQNLFEHTFKVPFIISGPTIPKNSRATGNTYQLDVLPTLCDFAGIECPEVDGKSFRCVAEGKEDKIRDVLYGAYSGGTKPGVRCVKKGDWKLIKYDVLDGEVRKTLLFNLKENPNELMIEHSSPEVIRATGNKPGKNQVNLSNDPRYKDKLAEMEALLLEQMIEVGDPYRLWNQK